LRPTDVPTLGARIATQIALPSAAADDWLAPASLRKGLFSGYNKLMAGVQVEPDEKPWYG
jgi:hypothetical protein